MDFSYRIPQPGEFGYDTWPKDAYKYVGGVNAWSEILWETTLSHEVNGQPSMFLLDGKQYLVVNASSNFARDSYDHSKKPGALPKGYVVFGLSEK